MTVTDTTEVDWVTRLSRDLKEGAARLDPADARSLVGAYYELQEHRIATAAQAREAAAGNGTLTAIGFLSNQLRVIERQAASLLDSWSAAQPMGAWARKHKGIGPVLSAGLLAHIDITRCHTAGGLWRFAGLDPSSKWEKGQKRPWNAELKVICWRVGESFVKVSGREDAFYGRLYAERKASEKERNDSGANAAAAAATLAGKRAPGKTTEAYKHLTAGHLPPAQIHARARRWAVKLFLAHWFEEAYRLHYGTEPPLPYPIAQLGHVHRIEAPA